MKEAHYIRSFPSSKEAHNQGDTPFGKPPRTKEFARFPIGKKIFLIALALMFLPVVLAINLNVEKVSSREVMINGVNQPAIFDLNVTNLGASDNFQFYNLLGFSMAPKGTVPIAPGETKAIRLMVYPKDNLNVKGYYTFEYFIQGEGMEKSSQRLTMNIIDLKDAFAVGSVEISPETNSINIYIENKVNFNFEDLNVKFGSAFFKLEKKIKLGPYEKKEFTVELKKEDFDKLMAGFYTLNADVAAVGVTGHVEGTIKFVEQDLLKTTTKSSGFVINTQLIEKKNNGNVITSSEIIVKKNIISRLFTTFSPEPDFVDRKGIAIYYTWKDNIKPGEFLDVTVRTNWLFPLLVILFILAIVVLAKQYSRTNVVLKKRVSFVHAKGGEFALKVSIMVSTRKHVERICVMDRVPALVSLYNKFGGERPTRINEKLKRIEWDLGNMDVGEKRMLSYLIYSKVGVMGKFILPEATAVYEREGEIHESQSNKAFFIAEQRRKDLED